MRRRSENGSETCAVKNVTIERIVRLKTFLARSADEWRRWLEKHHDSESEVWLIFYKRHTGEPTVDYADALDEALCYGWIDSLIKRIDDSRFARKFTPRKANSRWSPINRQRYAALKAAGRLKQPGVARPPTKRTYDPPPPRPATVPPYILDAIKKNAALWRHFEALTRVERLRYAHWIDSAKRSATKTRRLNEALRILATGKPLGLK
jgi:uncharacterized protein YdeI (YjbR/CyaY-like superfamily)